MLKDLGEREVVLVPLDTYNTPLGKLKDLVDMLEALKEPRRPLAEYLAEVKARANG